jgi:hypothetical protein
MYSSLKTMNISKKLNGLKSAALEVLAGEGLTLTGNTFRINDEIVTTDTQLATLASTLVTQSALATAIDPFITSPQLRDVTDYLMDTLASKDALATATSGLVTEDELAAKGYGALNGENEWHLPNHFYHRIYLFRDFYIYRGFDIHGGAYGNFGDPAIKVFRDLELLRSHFTAPTWVTVTLDPAHFRADGYWPEGPQYTKFQYGDSYKVQLRGEIREKDDYLNATDTRVLFNLPVGYRPLKRQMFMCGGGSGGVAASVLVNTDGNVLFMPQSSVVEPAESVSSLYLCPISFFTN